MNTPDLVTLAVAIERICTERHGTRWAAAKENELKATRDRIEKGNTAATVDNWIKAQKAAEEIRRPIELEILEKMGTAQLPAFRQLSNEQLLPIAPDQWNIFKFEANRDWPNVEINGKSEIVFLYASALAEFIKSDTAKALVTRHGRRLGENWNMADEPFFEKMKIDIAAGMSIFASANNRAPDTPKGGEIESKARRLRDGYNAWATKHGS
jgi:hypothetical protein